MSLKKAIELIRKNKVFLITTHINPEADAIGSELALFYLLRKLRKQPFIVNESDVPSECKFMAGIDNIHIRRLSKINLKEFDCSIFLDCSEASRAGEVGSIVKEPTLNIDHHISNTRFAAINWVSFSSSSTSQMIYRLYKELKIAIDKDIATMLYAGMMVDTGSFRYNNTTAATHRIAGSLIEKGVSANHIYNFIFNNNSFNDIKLLGRILIGVRCALKNRICWAEIPYRLLGDRSDSSDLSEIVLGILRSIRDVELAMIFREVKGKKDYVRINFRSRTHFDCNKLASKFGGGGHKNASGATATGKLTDIKRKVVAAARQAMKQIYD